MLLLLFSQGFFKYMSGRSSINNPTTNTLHYRHMLEELDPTTSAMAMDGGPDQATTNFLSPDSAATKNPFAFSIDDDMLDITTDARRDVSDLVDRSQGSKNLMADVPLPEDSSQRTHYDDFHTIDWLKDLARDRFRHRIIEQRRKESIWQQIVTLHDSWSGWICVLLVGLSSGLVAAIVDIGTNWMTHIKDGMCVNAFWLNKPQCCWASKNITYDRYNNPKCPEVSIKLLLKLSILKIFIPSKNSADCFTSQVNVFQNRFSLEKKHKLTNSRFHRCNFQISRTVNQHKKQFYFSYL